MEVCIGIPIMLIHNHTGDGWYYPEQIFPLGEAAGQEHGLVYDLVGRVFFSSSASHFVSYSHPPDSTNTVLFHDGMQNSGFAIQTTETGLPTDLPGSNNTLPHGYGSCAVTYHLRGGASAQNYFFQQQRKKTEDHWGLQFSNSFNEGKLPEARLILLGVERVEEHATPWRSGSGKYLKVEYQVIEAVDPMTANNVPDLNPMQIDPVLLGLDAAFVTSTTAGTEVAVPIMVLQQQHEIQPHVSGAIKSATPEPNPPTAELEPDAASELSVYSMNCRCGVQGDGNLLMGPGGDDQATIVCIRCDDWSHIACQREGRATGLGPNVSFMCDGCVFPGAP